MHSLFKRSRKRIVFLSLVFFITILFVTNISVQIINDYYRNVIIDQENQEFIELYVHLVEFSSSDEVLTIVDHYSHTNNASIQIFKNDEEIYSNVDVIENPMTYESEVNNDYYQFKIDNFNSYVAVVRDREILYINIIVFSLYIVLILYFILTRLRRNQKTVHDIKEIQSLLSQRKSEPHFFFFDEFHRIYHDILEDINTIDLLNEKRSDSLSGLVHDLKTPITIIKYHLEEDDVFENKEAIIQSLNDLTNLASDLVSQDFNGEHSRSNLSKVLNEQIELYTKTFLSKHIQIKKVILEDIYVNFNKRNLIRVIQNLMTNAFYYSYENTSVSVHLIHGKESFNLEISNKGNTLDPNIIEDIFSKRIIKDDSESSNGFGLYITKLLVQDAGAKISVKSSENLTKFIIEFPKKPFDIV